MFGYMNDWGDPLGDKLLSLVQSEKGSEVGTVVGSSPLGLLDTYNWSFESQTIMATAIPGVRGRGEGGGDKTILVSENG